ncbi:hypothetical protein [Ensifer sp. ENS12]|uniref:hypothetical protein n=1 Tax=Ensifer sp. ENS12 TaxID=2854774 RepID=UPI001C493AB7|nr:hypothetical protein [Ensifer sp. ENS12]MBV7521467.1 hypothetical protein [Ensifer sp. ENS12]
MNTAEATRTNFAVGVHDDALCDPLSPEGDWFCFEHRPEIWPPSKQANPGKAPADRACRGHHSADARPSRNPSEPHSADPVIDPQTTEVGIERRTDDYVKAALLDAADMIRILRIILDGKE